MGECDGKGQAINKRWVRTHQFTCVLDWLRTSPGEDSFSATSALWGRGRMTLAARESPQAAEVLAFCPTWARPKSMWECTDPEDPGVRGTRGTSDLPRVTWLSDLMG